MTLSNVGCKLLLHQMGKRKTLNSSFVCRHTGGNTVCIGIPEDYFLFICDILCLIRDDDNNNTTNEYYYDKSVCCNHLNQPKRLFYNFDVNVGNLNIHLSDEEKRITASTGNPESTHLLDFYKYLEFFGFETERKKQLLSIYTFLLYNIKLENEFNDWAAWEKTLVDIRNNIVLLGLYINERDRENRIHIIFEENTSSLDGLNKKIFEDFILVFNRLLNDKNNPVFIDRMLRFVDTQC